MPNITVKNIPDNAYQRLKQSAKTHRRSVNSEIIFLIEKATLSTPYYPEQHIAAARRSRAKTNDVLLTEDVLQKAKNESRP